MSKKARSLAINLSKRISKYSTHQQVYDQLVELANEITAFTSFVNPDDLLKMTFYVKDYLTNGKIDKSEILFHNIEYIGLVLITNENTEEDCRDCGGDGYLSNREECETCDGYGYIITDGRIIEIFNIVSWSEPLNYKSETTKGKAIQTISENKLYELIKQDKVILLSRKWDFLLNNELDVDNIYCAYSKDTAKLNYFGDNTLYFVGGDDVRRTLG